MSMSRRTDTGARAVAIQRVVEETLIAYLRTHRIGAHHPCESSVWNIPTTLLAMTIAARLAVLRDGSRAIRVDVEVAIEVEDAGRDWSFELALLTARQPTPQRPFRLRRERICRVMCDNGDVTVDECDPVMACFGDALSPILLTLANGQFVW